MKTIARAAFGALALVSLAAVALPLNALPILHTPTGETSKSVLLIRQEESSIDSRSRVFFRQNWIINWNRHARTHRSRSIVVHK